MDENQNIAQSPIQPTETAPTPVSNKKSLLGLAVLLILILAGIIGISFLTNKKPAPSVPATSVETAKPLPTVTPTTEEELDQVTLESPDQDFVDITADLNQL